MSDFQVPEIDATAAEKAVYYILQRVQKDPNFRYLMMGTQTLMLCVMADDAKRGIDPSNASSFDYPPAVRGGDQPPRIVELERRAEALREFVMELPTDELACETRENLLREIQKF